MDFSLILPVNGVIYPPPPPEKYCGNRTPTMNEDVFPIENGRFPNCHVSELRG